VIRRLSAIATWVLLLHLNLIASDLVCAQHHEISGAGVAAMRQHHPHGDGVHQRSVKNGDAEACKVPTRADCCHAMASCTVSLGLGPSRLDVASLIMRTAGDTLSVDAPISLVFAPDPPPPKA
jgi:hypothetical protein